MVTSTTTEREAAFERFNRLAELKADDGTESLEMRRLAMTFNTAPTEEAQAWLEFLSHWMRKGDAEGMKVGGEHLYSWAKDNGYGALSYASITTFLLYG